MAKIFMKKLSLIICALAVFPLVVLPAQSRTWSRNPASLASDYLFINDNRGRGEFVMVIWLASPLIPNEPSKKAGRDLLDKYVVIGVGHSHTSNDGNISFDHTATLDVQDGNGQPLKVLSADTMPPTVVGALAVLQTVFSRSLGKFGQGVQWFAFEKGAVHACEKGGMSVLFADEKYTYNTPVPGCPSELHERDL